MAIELEELPPTASPPPAPRFWFWFNLLMLFLTLGVVMNVLPIEQTLQEPLPQYFWWWTVGVPIMGWCVLMMVRLMAYRLTYSVVDGWNEARESVLVTLIRQGRRSQQVLGASFSSALLGPEGEPEKQLDALLDGTRALRAQPSRLGHAALIHSRLLEDLNEDLEVALLRVLTQRLAHLAPILAQAPANKPLALLLEIDCRLPDSQWRPAWKHAWQASGIRQSTVPVDGHGLHALDQWLDQRIDDQAMLLVVAVQFVPEHPEGTAETAVAVLLGNRLTQNTLAPIAYLHRPEQERESNPDPLLYAARQALDWVPLPSTSIERVWRAGIDGPRVADLARVTAGLELPVKPRQGTCNLDDQLGHAGAASPWLAIAAATQSIERGAGAQFVFSGGDGSAALWATVMTPVPPL
jgi:hypothetical protein